MKNNLFVFKLGGPMLLHKTWIDSFMAAVKQIIDKEMSVVIVHGGGPQADEIQTKLGIPVKKINGRRITDSGTLEVVKMVYGGSINLELVSLALKNKIPAVGISGVDGQLAKVTKRRVKEIFDQKKGEAVRVDFGHVGDIKAIDTKVLKCLLAQNFIPIIACLGVDEKGEIYNINADSLATAIACELQADKLIFITDANGVKKQKDADDCFKHLTINKAKEMIKTKKITDGMIAKIENVETALKSGIRNVQIVGMLQKEKDWLEAFYEQKYGTVIYGE